MRKSASSSTPRSLRVAAAGVIALSVSACSQADRFAYDPFSNPFNGKETTGSLPSGGVSSQPLPPPGGGYQPSGYTAAPAYAPQPSYPQQQPYRQASYTPQQAPQRMAPPAPLPEYRHTQGAGWSAQGGQTVTVQPGDTVYSLGRRYGVPASTILQANNLPPGAMLNAGQRVVLPGYHGPAGNAPVQAANVQKPAPKAEPVAHTRPSGTASSRTHKVERGETLYSIARRYDVRPRDLAAANNVGMDYHVRIGESMSIPGAGGVQTAAYRPRETQADVVKPVYRPQQEQVQREDDNAPSAAAPEVKPAVATTTAGGTDFRWPVRGRVISGFGQKPNGQTNDGVNISVPEGTEIKAAEGGVVAYAGNELKGFGNLVLIRHGGEWVTAYAHASEILVKRGDVVRRGQVIARAGRTGNVSSPQLHFEVRRGASPVDPLKYLPQG